MSTNQPNEVEVTYVTRDIIDGILFANYVDALIPSDEDLTRLAPNSKYPVYAGDQEITDAGYIRITLVANDLGDTIKMDVTYGDLENFPTETLTRTL